jgi:hypothetical protein
MALNELRAENIILKDQLSDAVRGEVSVAFVQTAEGFQQRFIEKDMVIDLLRHDLNKLQDGLSAGEWVPGEAQRQCTVLDKNVQHLIHEFRQMKASFLKFLDANKNV